MELMYEWFNTNNNNNNNKEADWSQVIRLGFEFAFIVGTGMMVTKIVYWV